jgi:arylsulfatase A-like enzyme
VIHSWANADGTQKIEDTGPLTKKRMETVDDETSDRSPRIHRREQQQAGNPWFVWWNGTRMHFRTHVKAEHRGISGQDEYADGMVEHDMHVGKFLRNSMNWTSPTTPSFFTPPTMALITTPGRMQLLRHFSW